MLFFKHNQTLGPRSLKSGVGSSGDLRKVIGGGSKSGPGSPWRGHCSTQNVKCLNSPEQDRVHVQLV